MDGNAKKFINISIWLTAILLLVRFLIAWSDVKNMWEAGQIISLIYILFSFVGEVIGISLAIMAIFNKWAWKWKWVCWIHDVPILAKKYNGTFKSDYESINLMGEIVIYQTFLNVWILLKTEESISRSLTAAFSNLNSVQYLIYTYQNDPRAEIQDRSPIHYGTAILNFNNPMILEGNYFTSRKTRGSMKFEVVE